MISATNACGAAIDRSDLDVNLERGLGLATCAALESAAAHSSRDALRAASLSSSPRNDALGSLAGGSAGATGP
jgi:hypothetical protein